MIESNIKTKVVGVDIGMAATTYGIVDIRGNVIARDEFITTECPNISDFVTQLAEGIVTLAEANGGLENIRSVGISSPSGNFLTGCIENTPNFPWKGVVPLAAMLRDRLGVATVLDNNANATAMAERAFGAAHGIRDFILITLGSGLGSCFYSKGKIYQGNLGFAGEVGHTVYLPNGRLCGCGKHGCLEAYTASKGIIQTATEVMEESDQPSRMRLVQGLTPKVIGELCEQGDALAIEVLRRTGHILGIGLANYSSILNPEAIIIAGGIVNVGKWLMEPTNEAFEAHVFHNAQGKIKIMASTLRQEERDILGASVLAWGVKEYSLFK